MYVMNALSKSSKQLKKSNKLSFWFYTMLIFNQIILGIQNLIDVFQVETLTK